MRNTFRRLMPICLALLLCIIVFGCRGATTPASFYALTPVSTSQVAAEDQQPLKGITIGIGPIKFPKTLDRPQIITRPSPNRLQMSEYNRWGGDLKQDFLNVLTQNISLMASSNQVAAFPWLENFDPMYRVLLDVHQFDGNIGESVRLNVSWMIKKKQDGSGNGFINRSVIEQPVSGNDYDALVKAQSEALKTLSQAIVDEIKRRDGKIN